MYKGFTLLFVMCSLSVLAQTQTVGSFTGGAGGLTNLSITRIVPWSYGVTAHTNLASVILITNAPEGLYNLSVSLVVTNGTGGDDKLTLAVGYQDELGSPASFNYDDELAISMQITTGAERSAPLPTYCISHGGETDLTATPVIIELGAVVDAQGYIKIRIDRP